MHQDGHHDGHQGVSHDTETAESGAFAFARCACGWRGPARRSRDRARTDARTHETTDTAP
ncbi:hypothetical protein RGF97_14990 [Streptomyces roseicoloratus]|uniref:Mobile element transfer n=1 Tax=Streptomyces roseicoloratus TaxID=2508722 RepID=A0ABY9RYD6_9ACTN|nr:hypothetical protein [Streptomyces roseicoloratus]WMX45900.1 hypothetical protein RGF97_14990 [Streptomyces roseicoloratus]